jgi:nucleotide-binding universal stress UspA family protein
MARALGFRNLLVPVSNNVESERAMDVACRLAADHKATITVVSVVEVPPVLPLGAHMKDEEEAAHRLLERVSAIADTYGVNVAPRILRARDAAQAVVSLTEERHTEILVIGAPRRRSKAFGPTVEHVLKKAACRVMVIEAAPAETARIRTEAA